MAVILIFWIFLIVLNLGLWSSRKKQPIVFIVTLTAIFILMCGNSEGPDVTGMMYVYTHQDEYQFNDFGYQFLENFFYNDHKVEFLYFRSLLTLVCFYLIHKTLVYYKVNYHLVLALYMMYMFFMDTIQMRNFFVVSALTYSFKYLCIPNTKATVKFVLIIFLVSTLHIAALVNLLFLLNKYLNKKFLIYTGVVLGILIFGASLMARFLGGNLLMVISNMIISDGTRGSGYLETETRYSGIVVTVLIILNLYYCYKSMKRLELVNNNTKYVVFSEIFFTSNILLFSFISTLLINISFYRFFRNMFLLQYILYAMYLDSYKLSNSNRMVHFIGIFILTLLWFIIDICIVNSYEECVTPIFEHNFIWEK